MQIVFCAIIKEKQSYFVTLFELLTNQEDCVILLSHKANGVPI